MRRNYKKSKPKVRAVQSIRNSVPMRRTTAQPKKQYIPGVRK